MLKTSMLAVLAVGVALAPAPEGKPAEGKDLKVLATGSWRPAGEGGTKAAPVQKVIRSAEELALAAGLPADKAKDAGEQKKVAETVAKAFKVDAIDFTKQMVVVVTAGSKPTGGWKVEVEKVTAKDKAATVKWKATPPEGFATQAFTHPGVSVLVEKFDGEVKFDPAAKGGGADK